MVFGSAPAWRLRRRKEISPPSLSRGDEKAPAFSGRGREETRSAAAIYGTDTHTLLSAS